MFDSQNPKPPRRKLTGTFYRLHSAKHFFKYSDSFFRNFIETRRKFESQERFAGARCNCGFYFGGSAPVAMAEAMFYSGAITSLSAIDLTQIRPSDLLTKEKERGREKLFLSVNLAMDGFADFTDWRAVEQVMRFGHLRWKGSRPEYEATMLAPLIAPSVGGTELTDILGLDAKSEGYNGVIFPSVRALMFAGGGPTPGKIRMNLESVLRMSTAGNIMDLHWQASQQMKQEFNIVVFSGTELTRSIQRVEWLDASDGTGAVENPYCGASDEKIELARLRVRAHEGLHPIAAAEAGLLTQSEMELEFDPEEFLFPNQSAPR